MTDTDCTHNQTGITTIDMRAPDEQPTDTNHTTTSWTALAFAALGGLSAGAITTALFANHLPIALGVIA